MPRKIAFPGRRVGVLGRLVDLEERMKDQVRVVRSKKRTSGNTAHLRLEELPVLEAEIVDDEKPPRQVAAEIFTSLGQLKERPRLAQIRQPYLNSSGSLNEMTFVSSTCGAR
jgi:hypothetical protein